ncbi:hypothetical protein CYMTET_18499 [Cymbomonas tetramitiformis]|uniref:Uncharacterized protein n=1 Tax=Cymbomonas tetramitiformis TaxID=36881 RepID=A0AAE0G843_9CHLO|nr:hypothetical protein CYMTET_18499 [Cymbomonas tetramitiformis]
MGGLQVQFKWTAGGAIKIHFDRLCLPVPPSVEVMQADWVRTGLMLLFALCILVNAWMHSSGEISRLALTWYLRLLQLLETTAGAVTSAMPRAREGWKDRKPSRISSLARRATGSIIGRMRKSSKSMLQTDQVLFARLLMNPHDAKASQSTFWHRLTTTSIWLQGVGPLKLIPQHPGGKGEGRRGGEGKERAEKGRKEKEEGNRKGKASYSRAPQGEAGNSKARQGETAATVVEIVGREGGALLNVGDMDLAAANPVAAIGTGVTSPSPPPAPGALEPNVGEATGLSTSGAGEVNGNSPWATDTGLGAGRRTRMDHVPSAVDDGRPVGQRADDVL